MLRVFPLRGLKKCTQVSFSSKKVLPNYPDDSTANFSQFGSSQVRCKVSDRSHPLHISKSLFSTSKKVNHDGDPDDSKSKSSQFGSQVHFKVSDRSHPLPHISKGKVGDHFGLQQNHVWDEAEIKVKMEHLYHHTPVTVSDKVMHGIMRSLYHSFNFITGYEPENTEVKAMEWRLIVLESVAGVPGFVAAAFRHFKSLRSLQHDHGWIPTLLEEAENERMHLLTCLKMFDAGPVTRAMVVVGQFAITPFLIGVYLIKPKAGHRFVGYLEETACETYKNVITQIETPGTPLHKEWSQLPAPDIAKGYWRLNDNAMWVDTLKCIFADEANHRDVNHTFSSMESDDPSPFVDKHREDAAKAWVLEVEGEHSTVGSNRAKSSL